MTGGSDPLGHPLYVAARRTLLDALDVLRLLRAVSTGELVSRFRVLVADERSREVTEGALEAFSLLFAHPGGRGCSMAARAAAPLVSEDEVRVSAATLAVDLLKAL